MAKLHAIEHAANEQIVEEKRQRVVRLVNKTPAALESVHAVR